MDKFFKLVNSDVDPSCPEANEYLAEDRVMCLQIYIKEKCGYYLTYVPDAKSFTDAPDALSILVKQRRRWNNGSLFAAYRVIANSYNMIAGPKSTHPWYAKIGMLIFMIYFGTMQIFSFFLVGSFYVTTKLFFANYFKQVTDKSAFYNAYPQIWTFFNGNGEFTFGTLFSYGYAVLVIYALLVSIASPIEGTIQKFKVIGAILSVFTIISIFGIAVFLGETGFYPPEMMYDHTADNPHWEPTSDPPTTYFSILTLAGTVMLSIYLVPMLLRPADFFFNMKEYLCGFLAYMLLLPMYTNLMQIYSMCNLHDLSWGNRPSGPADGAEALAENAKKQLELKNRYMKFRVNFLTIWIVANTVYALVVEDLADYSNSKY